MSEKHSKSASLEKDEKEPSEGVYKWEHLWVLVDNVIEGGEIWVKKWIRVRVR